MFLLHCVSLGMQYVAKTCFVVPNCFRVCVAETLRDTF